MKVVKFTNNPNYVRYSKNVEVKVNEFITVIAECYGAITAFERSSGIVEFLEDPEVDLEFIFNGEKCKYEGFKELYQKLFKKEFKQFKNDIIDFINKKIAKQYPNNIIHWDNDDIIKLAHTELNDTTKHFKGADGNNYIRRNWVFNAILSTFNVETPPFPRIETNTYGQDLSKCHDALTELSKKLYLI